MARIASAMADITVITSNNSRSENPMDIIGDILRGIDKESEYTVIPNRTEAILLCGKGHERYEIDGTGRHTFDERAVVGTALRERDEG